MTLTVLKQRLLSAHCNVILDDSHNAYASRDIQPGELIEAAPVILVPPRGRVSAFRTHAPLSKAAYLWRPDTDEIALSMGYLALYGYSTNPNAEVTPDYSMRMLRATATRFIPAGEYLTRVQQFNGQTDESVPLPRMEPGRVTPGPLVVQKSQWGLGVFAAEDIASGGILEVCPVIVIGPEDRIRCRRLDLHRYVYIWKLAEKRKDDTVALALGYGGAYNHSDTDDNAEFEQDLERGVVTLYATKDIPKGSEILHNYYWGEDDKRFQ